MGRGRAVVWVVGLLGVVGLTAWTWRAAPPPIPPMSEEPSRLAERRVALANQAPPTLEPSRSDTTPPAEPPSDPGWWLEARLPGAPLPGADWRAWVGLGQVDEDDAAEATRLATEGAEAPAWRDLITYGLHRPLDAPVGGVVRAFVPPAASYELLAVSDESVVAERYEPPDLPYGRTWRLDSLPIRPVTSLALRFTGVSSAAPYRVELGRASPTASPTMTSLLRVVAPELADGYFSGARLPLPRDGDLRLAPLPEEVALTVRLFGDAGGPVLERSVAIVVGRENRLDLAISPNVAATLRGRVVWDLDRAPVPSAVLRRPDGSPIAATARDGSFEIAGVPAADRLSVVVTEFDPDHPERRHSIEVDPSAASDDLLIPVPRYRWVRARGLTRPSNEVSARPLALGIETREPGGDWRPVAADVYRDVGDGVEVSVTEVDREYRVVAFWSSLLAIMSRPVGITATDLRVDTDFEPLDRMVWFARGVVVRADGTAAPFAHVEVGGSLGGLPPLSARGDASGRFSVGPISLDAIELLVADGSGVAEVRVDRRVGGDELRIELGSER